jgi:hypothetical protein
MSSNKNAFQASEALQPYFKERRLSVVQVLLWHTYKIRHQDFFPTICLTQESKGFNMMSYVRGQRSHVLNQEFLFFGSQVLGFRSDPSCLKYWLLQDLFYKEAMCKGSTGNELLYAAKAVP